MTVTVWENEQQEQWAAEYAAEYAHTIDDVLDSGETFRAKQIAYVQNRDAAAQALAGAKRDALVALHAAEKGVGPAYDRLIEVLEEASQVFLSATAIRDAYDRAWKAAHALLKDDVPPVLPTLPIRAAVSTEDGLVLRRQLGNWRAVKAAELP